MLPAPGQEILLGGLGPGRQDNEGCRYLFLAGSLDGRAACVGDRRVAEQNPFHVAGGTTLSHSRAGKEEQAADRVRAAPTAPAPGRRPPGSVEWA